MTQVMIPIKDRKIEIPNKIWEDLIIKRYDNKWRVVFVNQKPVIEVKIGGAEEREDEEVKRVRERGQREKREVRKLVGQDRGGRIAQIIEQRAKESGKRGIHNLVGLLKPPKDLEDLSWQEIREKTRESIARHVLGIDK